MTKTYTSLTIANTVALAATIIINVLANTIPLGGLDTSQISAMYPTLLTPIGYTFIIWAVIYGLLIITIIKQLLTSDRTDTQAIGPYFIISCILNIAWIFTWHSQMIVLSTITIIGLFLVLMQIYRTTRYSGFFTRTTFSIYYAWIGIASFISLFIMIKTLTGNAPVTPIEPRMSVPYESTAFTNVILIAGEPEIVSYVTDFEYITSTIGLALICGLVCWHFIRHRDYWFVGTVFWALAGIMYKQLISPTPPILMLIVAVIGIAAIVFVIIKHEMDLKERRLIYDNL